MKKITLASLLTLLMAPLFMFADWDMNDGHVDTASSMLSHSAWDWMWHMLMVYWFWAIVIIGILVIGYLVFKGKSDK